MLLSALFVQVLSVAVCEVFFVMWGNMSLLAASFMWFGNSFHILGADARKDLSPYIAVMFERFVFYYNSRSKIEKEEILLSEDLMILFNSILFNEFMLLRWGLVTYVEGSSICFSVCNIKECDIRLESATVSAVQYGGVWLYSIRDTPSSIEYSLISQLVIYS